MSEDAYGLNRHLFPKTFVFYPRFVIRAKPPYDISFGADKKKATLNPIQIDQSRGVTMKTRTAAIVWTIGLLGSMGFGQSPMSEHKIASTGADIYTNFVGTWVGSSQVLRGNNETVTPLKIEITEDVNKTHLRFFFTFREHGRPGFDHVTRVATLDPAKKEMTWLETDNLKAPDALRKTEGLQEFARKGYGAFDATYGYSFGKHHLAARCHYVLAPNMFTYVWYQNVDGGVFVKYSITQVERESNPMAVLRDLKF